MGARQDAGVRGRTGGRCLSGLREEWSLNRRSRALIVTASVIGGGILVAGAEIALRTRESHRTVLSGSTPSSAFYVHERYRRALVRGAAVAGATVSSHGFRGRDATMRKPPATTRILALGASTTFDPCVGNDDLAWTARLEHWLRERAPGRDFEVINAGVPGHDLLDIIVRLQSELYAYEPDLILLYAGHGVVNPGDLDRVDDAARRGDPRPDESAATSAAGRWFARNSLLYGKLSMRFARHDGPDTELTEADWARATENATDRFHRDLAAFALLARRIAPEVVFVEIVHASAADDGDHRTRVDRGSVGAEAWINALGVPARRALEGYRRFSEVWRVVADSFDVSFIPREALDITAPSYFCGGDPIHFSAAGAERMASRLADSLLALEAEPGLEAAVEAGDRERR